MHPDQSDSGSAFTTEGNCRSGALAAQVAQDDVHRLFEGVRQYAAPIRIDPAPCDLPEVWRQAWDDLSWRAGWERAELHEETGGVDLQVMADGALCFGALLLAVFLQLAPYGFNVWAALPGAAFFAATMMLCDEPGGIACTSISRIWGWSASMLPTRYCA